MIGTAELVIVDNLTHHGMPWATVENVVVAATHRGRGVGGALTRHALRLAADAGCYKIQLLSRKTRHDAHRFYTGLGFESTAEGLRLYLD